MARKSRKSNIYKRLFFCLIFINLLFLGYLIFQKTEWFSYLENKFHQTFIRSSIPEGDYIYGIDVSQYQGIIDWNKLNSKTNSYLVDFALIRATAGKNHRDIYYTYNWNQSKKNDIIRGAYHYYRPNENSTEQAKNFIANVKLEPKDFPPILDIEQLSKIQSVESLKEGIKNWLNLIEAHYGIKPILYSGTYFYRDYLSDFKDYKIWVANYNNIVDPLPEKNWIMWQFSDNGSVEGIEGPVDQDLFRGNKKDLNLYLLK